MSAEPRPRLCVLEKGSDGYGFHLHGEKNKLGQFIRLVEPDSPAELSGLQPGDRLVFVNGECVDGESHQQVVSRIRAVSGKLELIVVDAETAELLHKHGLKCRKEFVTDGLPIPGDTAPTPEEKSNGTAAEFSPVPATAPDSDPVPDPLPAADTNGDAALSQLSLNSEEPISELRPRLCLMKKGATGYGFNLHSEKSKPGQYIRAVDEDSPAEKSGLRPQDKVLQVNGRSVQGLQHSDVVAAIKDGGDELRLLVVDPETEEFFNRCQVAPTEQHLTGPLPEPAAVQIADETVNKEANQDVKAAPVRTSTSSSSSTASITDDAPISSPTKEKQVEKTDPALNLNISLQQAKERARQKRSNKKAPPMDWSKRSEVFSNL